MIWVGVRGVGGEGEVVRVQGHFWEVRPLGIVCIVIELRCSMIGRSHLAYGLSVSMLSGLNPRLFGPLKLL